MVKNYRNSTGSILVITAFIVLFVIVPTIMVTCQINLYMVDKQRLQNVIEAAGLLAANDMSRIIIDDPRFGFVSLSDHPPIGKATCAPDGEPLPVTGINTLVGTIRQCSLVARELRNPTMARLADIDRFHLQTTISNLNSTLSEVASGINSGCSYDINGEVVDPTGDVTAFLTAHLPDNMELESIRLSTGWLRRGSTTTTPVPHPQRLAQLSDEDCQGGHYRAFTDVPVEHRSFSFAGVGSTSSIVDASDFQEADSDHICSIVKLECSVVRKDRLPTPLFPNFASTLSVVACCQPYAESDLSPRGAMTLRFSGPPVTGVRSWSEFLRSGNFRDNRVTSYDVWGGDYPIDSDAQIRQVLQSQQLDTSQQFAEHLYYWLRNGHVRPRLDAVLEMINEPFRSSPNEMYVYEFADTGLISRKTVVCDQFPRAVIAEAQSYVLADTTISSGMSPVILFRNNVKELSTKYGGKHCGQPLAGYPLDWRELRESANNEQLACRFAKRRLYRRGLALDIEIGGTRESTASADVTSMRERLRGRRI